MDPKVSVIIPAYNVEEYIGRMLSSVEAQTFKDFEAIIVNDGSTDGSLKIIDGFCKKDSRFKSVTKDNGGVASARNLGIDLARGEYIVFYDADDYIPPGALKGMYHTAGKSGADMVIGVMVEKNFGESLIYMHSQKLAQQKKIKPEDRHFQRAWSICNKMFSLNFIKSSNLRFEKMKYAEDGVFTYCALNRDPKICGCDVVAYNYIRRPFWHVPSATQKINAEYMSELFASHDRIIHEAEKLAWKRLPPGEREEYTQGLYARFIEAEMINGYYRAIWRAEKPFLDLLTERIEEYKKHISAAQWKRILKKNRDLQLDKGYRSQEEIAEKPAVSILASGRFTEKEIDLAMKSLYCQGYISFEVLLPEKNFQLLKDRYREKINLRRIETPGADAEDFPDGEGGSTGGGLKKRLLDEAKGEYILFLNEPVIFTRNTLRQMEQRLFSDPGLDFAAMLLKNCDSGDLREIPSLSAAYGYTRYGRTRYDKLTSLDIFLSNKLIRKSSLIKFLSSGKMRITSEALYRNMSFEKLRKGVIAAALPEGKVSEGRGRRGPGIYVRFNYLKNKAIGRFIEKAKRKITKEDIERLRRKTGR